MHHRGTLAFVWIALALASGCGGSEDPPAQSDDGSTGDTAAASSGPAGSSDDTGSVETGSGGSEGSGDESTGADGSEDTGVDPSEVVYDCTLDVDGTDPRCQRSDDYLGMVGTGPLFIEPGVPSCDIEGGVVDAANDRLYVIVQGYQPHDLTEGFATSAIFSVDLETGDRTVVSGMEITLANGAFESARIVGTGPNLFLTNDVKLGDDGNLYAADSDGLFRIDPATGNRELLRVWSAVDDPCFFLDTGGSYFQAFVLEGSDDFYFGMSSAPYKGLVHFQVSTGLCEIVSADGEPTVGAGDDFFSPPTGIVGFDGDFFVGDYLEEALWRVDRETGDRTKVSDLNDDIGSGEGCIRPEWMMVLDGRIWGSGTDGGTLCPSADTGISSIDPATGQRDDLTVTAGPMQWTTRAIWAHPDASVVITAENAGIVLYDPASGKSAYLSR